MEARAAFDRLLSEGETVPAPAARSAAPDRVVEQNREFVRSLAGLGVPVPVIH